MAAVLCAIRAPSIVSAGHIDEETKIPCGIRCALAIVAVLKDDGRVPDVNGEALRGLPAQGRSFLGIRRFLRGHGVSGKAYSDVAVNDLRPTAEQPAILQLSPEWAEHGIAEAQRPGFVFERDGLPHFVLAVKREGAAVLIWDVTVGHEFVPLEELQPYFTGNVMTVSRQPLWLRSAYGMATRRDIFIAGGVALLTGFGILVFRLRKSPQTNGE